MVTKAKLREYMTLTPADLKNLDHVVTLITTAKETPASTAASYLQQAEDLLRQITRGQFWRTL